MNVKKIEITKNTPYYLKNRKYLVKLLKYLAYKLKFQNQTLYLSIYLMDIVFNHPEFEISHKLESYAISCIMIAAKFDENDPNIPDLRHFQTTSSNFLSQNHSERCFFPINELRSTEVKCMKILDHKLNYFTVYHFLFYFLCHGVVLQSESKHKSSKEMLTLLEDIKSLSYEILEKVIESEEEVIFNFNSQFAIAIIFLAREKLLAVNQEEFLYVLKIVYRVQYENFKEMYENAKKIFESSKNIVPFRNSENEIDDRKRFSRKKSPKIDKKYRAVSSNKYNYENLNEKTLSSELKSNDDLATKIERVKFNFNYNNYEQEFGNDKSIEALLRNDNYHKNSTVLQVISKCEERDTRQLKFSKNDESNDKLYFKNFPSSKCKDMNTSRNIQNDLVQRTRKVFDDKDVRKPFKREYKIEMDREIRNRINPTNNPSTIIINNNININTIIPKEYIHQVAEIQTKSSQNIEKTYNNHQSQNDEKLVILKRGNSDIINLKQVISMDSHYHELPSRNRYEPKKPNSNKTVNSNIQKLQLNFDYNQIHDEFS